MLEMAESQHNDAQEILFQACSWRVGTNADSAKPSRYNPVSDWDDCVPEWHKSLIGPHFKDSRDCTSLCNHPLTAHETFTGTGNRKYYHKTAAHPLNNLLSSHLCQRDGLGSMSPGYASGIPNGQYILLLIYLSLLQWHPGSVWSHVPAVPHCCLSALQLACSAHNFPWSHSKDYFGAKRVSLRFFSYRLSNLLLSP